MLLYLVVSLCYVIELLCLCVLLIITCIENVCKFFIWVVLLCSLQCIECDIVINYIHCDGD